MSALVSNLGATFVTETGIRSSSVVGVHLTETVATGGATVDLAGGLTPSLAFAADLTIVSVSYVDLAGNLAPVVTLAADVADIHELAGNLAVTVAFAADVADIHDLTGGLAPSVTFGAAPSFSFGLVGDLAPVVSLAADLTVVAAPANYVDFSGNLGGPSAYGRLAYGAKHYSRGGAFAPIFAGDIEILGEDLFEGGLAPVVTFAGGLGLLPGLAGDLAPQVSFAADLSIAIGLAGDLPLQIGLGATLTGDVPFGGDLLVQIGLAASSLLSGPLWAPGTPGAPPWTPTDPCPPPLWTSIDPGAQQWTPTAPCPPPPWASTEPGDPVEWEETELCDG